MIFIDIYFLLDILIIHLRNLVSAPGCLPSGQNFQKTVWRGAFFNSALKIRHWKYSTILSKIHSYRLLFQHFCQLG